MDGWSYGADKTQGLRVFFGTICVLAFQFSQVPHFDSIIFLGKAQPERAAKANDFKVPDALQSA